MNSNTIHPSAVIEGDVQFGKNNTILPFCYLKGPLHIGDNNIIGPQVVIGSPGEDTRNPRHDSSQARIKIGNNNIIREHVAIQKPCYGDITQIGNDVFLMHGVHIPHDAIIEDHVSATPLSIVGGNSRIMKGANLGMGSSVHQNSIIGHYSIVATNAAAIKNVKPFSRYIPGKPISVNSYMIEKFNFKEWTDEISKYVLENRQPKSDLILKIVSEYEKFHFESKRGQY